MTLIRNRTSNAPTEDPAMVRVQEYRRKAKINRDDLSTDVEVQPQLLSDVLEAFVLAVSLRDEAKDELARLSARIAAEIRKECEQKGVKATKDFVDDMVIADPRHQKQADELRRLNRYADEWEALREVYRDRSKMLHELTELYKSGYYNISSAQGTRSEVSTALAAQAKERVGRARIDRMQKNSLG